jgi:hypothetical protein
VTGNPPAGWTVSDIRCDQGNDDTGGLGEDAFIIDVPGRSARIELSTNEHKSCVFVFTKDTPPAPPPPPPPPPPAVQVLPEVVVASAARLHAPTRCVSQRYTVAVTGAPVSHVTFYVNGRRAKRVRARTGQHRFSVRLAAPAKHDARVVAKVRFAAGARPRVRTLRATIRHCAAKAVEPAFTG